MLFPEHCMYNIFRSLPYETMEKILYETYVSYGFMINNEKEVFLIISRTLKIEIFKGTILFADSFTSSMTQNHFVNNLCE